MGKCGGHELNYVSDVDVIFAHAPAEGADENAALQAATQLASHLIRICSDHTGEGTIWPVDAALRPEGKAGPLVRTIASHRGYYERWAKTWEFQALLKARPVAGDLALGREFVDDDPPDGVVGRRARRLRRGHPGDAPPGDRPHPRASEAERQLKLGAGGLRDVEFAVQLLQLVHGRADERIRPPTTLSALAELTHGGYVGREDGEALHEAYAFLRTLEHRIQLHQLRRTHVVPEDEASLRRLGREHGLPQGPGRHPRQDLAAPPPRGPAAAREALLPPAAHRGRQDPRRRGAADSPRPPRSGWPRSASLDPQARCATSRRSPPA